mgnify:CR=1 FL=1
MKNIFVLVSFLLMINSLFSQHTNDTTKGNYKAAIEEGYTDLDSNFQGKIINHKWVLRCTYERTFLIFRKLDILENYYFIEFNDTSMIVSYGENKSDLESYTADYYFLKLDPEVLMIIPSIEETYLYQILRLDGNYLIVDYKYNNKSRKVKNPHKRLLFEIWEGG